jgi:hypothetical protein
VCDLCYFAGYREPGKATQDSLVLLGDYGLGSHIADRAHSAQILENSVLVCLARPGGRRRTELEGAARWTYRHRTMFIGCLKKTNFHPAQSGAKESLLKEFPQTVT